MSETMTQQQIAELRRIMDESEDGTLKPRDVLEFARNPETALHSRFCWDDSEAAEKYRLIQARKVIRVSVEIISVRGEERTVPVYVSIAADRLRPGGGYRPTQAVMSDRQLRAAMLATAESELEAFRRRYARLEELSSLIRSIDKFLARRKPVTAQAVL